MPSEELIVCSPFGSGGSMIQYILAWQGGYSLARQVLYERPELVRQSSAPINIIMVEVLVASLDRLAGDDEAALLLLKESL